MTTGYKSWKHEAQAFRSGCKVSWRYYDNEQHARDDAEIAKHNSMIDRNNGYDFGYCSPGSITFVKAGSCPQAGENGRWELCYS